MYIPDALTAPFLKKLNIMQHSSCFRCWQSQSPERMGGYSIQWIRSARQHLGRLTVMARLLHLHFLLLRL